MTSLTKRTSCANAESKGKPVEMQPSMAPNEDETHEELEKEDTQASAPEQQPDNGNDAQGDEDHQDHQGKEGSPEQWDQGGDGFGTDVSCTPVYSLSRTQYSATFVLDMQT